jgi:HlyD family secretion protein
MTAFPARLGRTVLTGVAALTAAAGCNNPSSTGAAGAPGPIAVQVVHPKPGGLVRVCSQPGTVMPFEGADLYSKVSGFLAEQSLNGKPVDIGTRVKKGDVLARISVPEYDQQVKMAEAKLKDTEATVAQYDARLTSAKADSKAAAALVAFAEAEVKSKTAYAVFRKKEYDRIKQLADQQAVDARLVDEQENQYEAAIAAEFASKEKVANSKAQAEAATARIASAEADLSEAKAQVAVASADLAKAKVWVGYTIITSPYDGVVTKRNFFPGDFVRAAENGGSVPMLGVNRTDKMRIVVPVPDRDVPFTKLGDPAVLEPDALPGKSFKGTVSRFAEAEDLATRTMRTEVDMENPDDRLRQGMYGRVTITLDKGTEGAIRIPSASLVGDAGDGRGKVRVVRDGKSYTAELKLGTDNGTEVEVIGGLTEKDEVIVQANGPLAEGLAVTVTPTPGK